MIKHTVLILAALLVSFGQAAGQDNAALAATKVEQAIVLIDAGAYDSGIDLLGEAETLAPGSYVYSYEKARAYYLQDDFAAAIDQLDISLKCKDATDLPYILLGRTYDIMGRPQKALSTFEKGLAKFPLSGELYFESGVVYMHKEEYQSALEWFERGIEADPYYASNYYHAAYIGLNTYYKTMSMVYGEIFITLEPDTKRTAMMSWMLYNTYRENIVFPEDGSATSLFGKAWTDLYISPDSDSTISFPTAYSLTLQAAVVGEKQINLASLNDIRSRFLDIWYSRESKQLFDYYCPLFEYQFEIRKAGHFEAYNYWLLSAADTQAFTEWQAANTEKFRAFAEWFRENPIIIE